MKEPLKDRIAGLVTAKSRASVREELRAERPEDLASAIERMSPEEAASLLIELDELQAASVVVELSPDTASELVLHLPDEVVAAYLDVLPMDDALDLGDELDEERFEALLEVIPEEDAKEIRRLRRYAKGSVGRLMTERYFVVSPETTVSQVLDDLRQASEDKYESVNDLYVTDEQGKLVGVVSLRRVLRAEPTTAAQTLMREDVVVAHTDDTAEDAARRMAKYGFYALPVLDADGVVRGLFTGDDAQSILREAESADQLAFGAVSRSTGSYLSQTPWQLFLRRIWWLLALFVAESLTGAVMRHYTGSMGVAGLVAFIPLIIGAGGNSGSQVTTTITRALALDEVSPGDWLAVIGRELVTALMIGGALGLLGYLRAIVGWQSGPGLSLVVGLALPSVVLLAATVGSVLPLAAKRLKVDPAVMSAPFITTFVDATGLVIFFEIARRIIPPMG